MKEMGSGARISADQPAAPSELAERLYHLERLRGEIYDAAQRVNEIADRLFGQRPEATGANKLDAPPHSLLSRMDEGLQGMDGNLGNLRSAISRLEHI